MKKPSLSFELEGFLRQKKGWCHPAELEDFARSLGFLSSNCTRRLRDLRKAGKVESQPREHGVTWWRYIPNTYFEKVSVYISETESKNLSLKL